MKKLVVVILSFILSIYFSLGNFIDSSYILSNKLNLGLDIRGGLSLLLEADTSNHQTEQINIIKNTISNKLKNVKVASNDRIIEVTGASEDQVLSIVESIIDRKFFSLDETEGKIICKISEKYFSVSQTSIIDRIIDVIRYRIDGSGIQEISIQKHGDNAILVQIPGSIDRAKIRKILSETGSLKFHIVDNNVTQSDIAENNLPLGVKSLPMTIDQDHIVNVPIIVQPIMTGEAIADSYQSTNMGRHVVNFKLTDAGTKRFAEITKNNVGKIMAIVLDNKVITAPTINEPIITGAGIISGHFTFDSAKELAIILRSGSLPVPIKIVQETLIGPTLGKDSIDSGANAVVIGCIAVIIIMIAVYRRLGVIAGLALICNLSLMIGILSLVEATLTLPGIAGMALTLGMAVDANVLIYERMKEERLKGSKSIIKIINKGYDNALRTILDSNITTVIVALILYLFGTSAVKGFAITLIIGIVSSVITAVIFTKVLIDFWYKNFRSEEIF
jgi:preprotein translocase subunit SecD